MVLPLIVVVYVTGLAGLYMFFQRRRGAPTFWRMTILIGLGIGIARAILASMGWYAVERTGGWLQIPGFMLAMLAWPEAAALPRSRVGRVTPGFYALLSSVLVASSALLVGAIAAVAHRVKTGTR
jgi:hypothetical protein